MNRMEDDSDSNDSDLIFGVEIEFDDSEFFAKLF